VPHDPVSGENLPGCAEQLIGISLVFCNCDGLTGCSYFKIGRVEQVVLDDVVYRIHVVVEFNPYLHPEFPYQVTMTTTSDTSCSENTR
jgi:hypothetical protein